MELWKQVLGGFFWLGLTFSAAAIGSLFMPDDWYRDLIKPGWNPPAWVFGPVWTLLYLMMAVAVWMVWRQFGVLAAAVPIGLFILQLLLNAMWSWLFFGQHQIGWAVVDIVSLWVLILATLVAFWKFVPLAGMLMIPYLLWVSFAAVLNATIWWLNR